jgi:hypothetical protein
MLFISIVVVTTFMIPASAAEMISSIDAKIERILFMIYFF